MVFNRLLVLFVANIGISLHSRHAVACTRCMHLCHPAWNLGHCQPNLGTCSLTCDLALRIGLGIGSLTCDLTLRIGLVCIVRGLTPSFKASDTCSCPSNCITDCE